MKKRNQVGVENDVQSIMGDYRRSYDAWKRTWKVGEYAASKEVKITCAAELVENENTCVALSVEQIVDVGMVSEDACVAVDELCVNTCDDLCIVSDLVSVAASIEGVNSSGAIDELSVDTCDVECMVSVNTCEAESFEGVNTSETESFECKKENMVELECDESLACGDVQHVGSMIFECMVEMIAISDVETGSKKGEMVIVEVDTFHNTFSIVYVSSFQDFVDLPIPSGIVLNDVRFILYNPTELYRIRGRILLKSGRMTRPWSRYQRIRKLASTILNRPRKFQITIFDPGWIRGRILSRRGV